MSGPESQDLGPHGVYGHCRELLVGLVGPSGGVHLDLACGRAPMAESLVKTLGVEYIGVDVCAAAVGELLGRGLEAHQIDLEDADVAARLADVIGGRRLAAVTLLDGLEHLRHPGPVLDAIAGLIAADRTVCVISVPNVTHLDVAVKALLGQWEYTPTGLLDQSHYRLYGHDGLTKQLRRSGLVQIEARDVIMSRSDQHFPLAHPALTPRTPVGLFLRGLRARADGHGETNQFVWALAPAPVAPLPDEASPRPAMSVVVVTQGRRPQELRELLLCLSAQSCRDFELIVVGQRTSIERQLAIEQVIADQTDDLRARTRLVLVEDKDAAAVLNAGIDVSRGELISVADEQDLLMGDWCRSLVEAARRHPEQMVRVQSVAQEQERVTVGGLPVLKSIASPHAVAPGAYSWLDHLARDDTPTSAWAFPRSLYDDLGLQFDLTMFGGHTWDFFLRAAELLGVEDVPSVQVTRRLRAGAPDGPVEDGGANVDPKSEVYRMVDSRPRLLPPGSTADIRAVVDRVGNSEAENGALRQEVATLRAELGTLSERATRLQKQVRRLRAAGRPAVAQPRWSRLARSLARRLRRPGSGRDAR